MADLIYLVLASLDGYVADKQGDFGWAEPDDRVHTFVNGLMRTVGLHLYGRRMYEVMTIWQTLELDDQPPHIADFAQTWRACEKVVYSATLSGPSTPKTRIEQSFDPEAVRRLKAEAIHDLSISGPTLAAHAFRAGLVDVCHIFLSPVLVGGGLRAFPDGLHLDLTLRLERIFDNGTVYLQYRSAAGQVG